MIKKARVHIISRSLSLWSARTECSLPVELSSSLLRWERDSFRWNLAPVTHQKLTHVTHKHIRGKPRCAEGDKPPALLETRYQRKTQALCSVCKNYFIKSICYFNLSLRH